MTKSKIDRAFFVYGDKIYELVEGGGEEACELKGSECTGCGSGKPIAKTCYQVGKAMDLKMFRHAKEIQHE